MALWTCRRDSRAPSFILRDTQCCLRPGMLRGCLLRGSPDSALSGPSPPRHCRFPARTSLQLRAPGRQWRPHPSRSFPPAATNGRAPAAHGAFPRQTPKPGERAGGGRRAQRGSGLQHRGATLVSPADPGLPIELRPHWGGGGGGGGGGNSPSRYACCEQRLRVGDSCRELAAPVTAGHGAGGRLCSRTPCVARSSGAAAPAFAMGLCSGGSAGSGAGRGPLLALRAASSRGLGRWGPLRALLFFFPGEERQRRPPRVVVGRTFPLLPVGSAAVPGSRAAAATLRT